MKIPKILHLIWTQDAHLSLLQAITAISFRKLNPDWRIIVHVTKQRDEELASNTYVPLYTGKDYFFMVTQIPQIEIVEEDLNDYGISLDKPVIVSSDELRLRILKQYGGVYSDFDVVWLRPMSEFHLVDHIGNMNDFQFMFCMYQFTHGHHNISVLMSEPSSKIVDDIIQEQEKIQPPYPHQAFGTDLYNRMFGTYSQTLVLYEKTLHVGYNTFFPYSIFNMDELWSYNIMSNIKSKDVMGIHWFNGHPLSKEYVNNNLYGKPCTMTSVLKREGYI